MNLYAIILAAGKGTRMKQYRSDVSKVAMPILGRPMLQWVLEATRPVLFQKTVTVLGYGGEAIESLARSYGEVCWQKTPMGTANAVSTASPFLGKEDGVTLVCNADTPLLTDKTISALLSSHQAQHNAVTMLTAVVENPHGQGRVIKTGSRVECIIEQRDCGTDFDSIHEINARVYAFDNRTLFRAIKEISADVKGEFHLTDVIRHILNNGDRVGAFLVSDALEIGNVNDRYELSLATKALQKRINRRWMNHGVTIEDPDATYIGPDAYISRDTVIRPGSYVLGKTKIGHGNVIGPSTYLEDAVIGEDNIIEFSHVVSCRVENNTHIGPYARLRDNAVVREAASVGNFNELKNVDFGASSRCAHLSYLGDAKIGSDVNVGCGVSIANFDGKEKHESVVKDGAFLGCGSVLVSPVSIGESAYVAAGSVITEDVPDNALGIARARQENKQKRDK